MHEFLYNNLSLKRRKAHELQRSVPLVVIKHMNIGLLPIILWRPWRKYGNVMRFLLIYDDGFE
jgi:hypothetical protein